MRNGDFKKKANRIIGVGRMRWHSAWVCSGLLWGLWWVAGCSPNRATPTAAEEVIREFSEVTPTTVLVVGGKPIYEEELERAILRLRDDHSRSNEVSEVDVLLKAAEHLVSRRVWLDDHEASVWPVSEAEIQQEQGIYVASLPKRLSFGESLQALYLPYSEFRENLIVEIHKRNVLARLREQVTEAPEERLRTYFDEHRDEFDLPVSVELLQVVCSPQVTEALSARKRAEAALVQLRGGERFSEVAWMHSNHSSRMNDGRVGRVYKGRNEYSKWLENVIFSLTPGVVGNVTKDGDTYYIFLVEEAFPPKRLSFEEVHPELMQRWEAGQLAESIREYWHDRLKAANIRFCGRLAPHEAAFWTTFYPDMVKSTAADGSGGDNP